MATEILKGEGNKTFHVKEEKFSKLMKSEPVVIAPSPLIDHLMAQSEEERLTDAKKFMELRRHVR